mgnify:CR=1 FL=1
MLRHLSIRDFVIVDRLELAFEAGFGALTGETGAGKSILLDALGLALGGKAEAGVVRSGQARAEIVAEFDLPPDGVLRAWLDGEEVPGGLQVDPDLRWRLVTNLARVGAVGEDEIASEASRDNTATGAEHAAGARSALRTPEAKEQ